MYVPLAVVDDSRVPVNVMVTLPPEVAIETVGFGVVVVPSKPAGDTNWMALIGARGVPLNAETMVVPSTMIELAVKFVKTM